jgi:hypothetical protein
MTAHARGTVAIAFYAAADAGAATLTGYLAQTTDALGAAPVFSGAAVNDPAHPIYRAYGDAYTPRADFIGAAYDRSGGVWGAFAKQLGAPDASNTIATTGYLGHLAPRRAGRVSRRRSGS